MDPQFNFQNTTIKNLIKDPKGEVSIQNIDERYEKGAVKNQTNIKGGNFPQANIAGQAIYNNKASNVTAGGKTGANGDWSYDVEEAVLEILKSGITTEQLLKAMLEKKKIKDIWNYVRKCKESSLNVVFDSFLSYDGSDDLDT